MNYLPILQELFESDTIIFFGVGAVVAAVVGFRFQNRKVGIVGGITSAFVYLMCELFSNVHTTFLVELILLFVGTTALGCFLGFAVSFVVKRLRGK